MKDLKKTLEDRANRATPGGSEQLRQRVVFTLTADKTAPRYRFRGPLVATAAASLTLAVFGGGVWLIGGDGSNTVEQPTATVTAATPPFTLPSQILPSSESPFEWQWELGETTGVPAPPLVRGDECYGSGGEQRSSGAIQFGGTVIDFTMGHLVTPNITIAGESGTVTEVGNPFGDRAWLCSVATTDTRILAVGSGVWWSDDGIAWSSIEAFEGFAGSNVDGSNLMWAAAGPEGYMVLGRGALSRLGWHSPDLQSWYEIPLEDGPEYSTWELVGPYRVDVGDELIIEVYDGAWIGTPVSSEAMTPATGSLLTPLSPVSPPVDAGPFGEVSWQTFEAPPYVLFGPSAATPFGFATANRDRLWTSTDSLDWTAIDIPADPQYLEVSGDDLYALGRGAARLSWTGAEWQIAEALSFPDLGVEVRTDPDRRDFAERMAFGDEVTVMTTRSGMYFSTDGHTFRPAQQGPDPLRLPAFEDGRCLGLDVRGGGWDGSIGPVFATANGFVAFTGEHPRDWPGRPMCLPVVWTSNDGSSWDLVSTESPFGSDVYVSDIAERNGLMIAVGGRGERGEDGEVLWESYDGLTWTEIPPERIEGSMTSAPWAIGSGEAGWVALHGDATDARVMYSLDGLTWVVLADELPDFYWAFGLPNAAVGVDRIVISYNDTVTIGEITR